MKIKLKHKQKSPKAFLPGFFYEDLLLPDHPIGFLNIILSYFQKINTF